MMIYSKRRNALYNEIDSLTTDIEFEYQGVHGSICPFSRTDISISYGDDEKSCTSVEEAMDEKMFSGKSLNEIADMIEII